MNRELPIPQELRHGDYIAYKDMTPKYGRAEFTFCIKWVRGKIDKVYISPKQQERPNELYVVEVGRRSSVYTFESWTHLGIERPWAWYYGWCKQHGCPFCHVYVPPKTRILKVNLGSDVSFIFE